MPARLLVIGIDAACPALLARWAAQGKLPAIRRLVERGLSGPVQGVEGFYVGSTWPSMYTGLGPASHGFYRIEQLLSGSYDFHRPLDAPGGVGGTPFWKRVSDAGRRVAVLDVPLSRIEPDLNGVQTVEWAGHDAVFGFQASSAEVARRVMSRTGAHPAPSNCDGARQTVADYEAFVSALEAGAGKKGELTVDFLNQEPWDLLVQVFTESHCVGHQCWHIHDPGHPAHDPALLAAIGDPLERVYRAVDRAVGAILAHAGDAHVLLFSAHGMGPYRGARFLLPEILYRLGATLRPGSVPLSFWRARNPARVLADAAWRRLPEGARESLRAWRARTGSGRAQARRAAQVGLSGRLSRCFAVPVAAPAGGIRLNLRGREPDGVLRPGAEAEAFCRQLSDDLCAIVDERDGRPLVAAVHRTDALHAGPRRDSLPDLLVEWNPMPIGCAGLAGGRGAEIRVRSAKIGTLVGRNEYGRTGEHFPTGRFVCAGPAIAPGGEATASVTDLAPTICSLLGVPAPGMDGSVIPALAGVRA
jgi:predicted AlkP superfamily phosphohydrolase/phosphomutase